MLVDSFGLPLPEQSLPPGIGAVCSAVLLVQNCSTQCDPVRFADCLVLFSLSGLYVVPALPEQRRDQRPAGVETSVLQEDLHSKLRQVFQLNGN